MNSSYGQNTFNRIYEREFNYQFGDVWTTQSSYYTMGTVIDTNSNGGVYPKLILSKYTLQGDLIISNIVGNESNPHIQTIDTGDNINDYLMVLGCQSFIDGVQYGKLIWFDQNCDTVKTKMYSSPYDVLNEDGEHELMAPTYIKTNSLGEVFVSYNIAHETKGNDCMIMKLDPDGNVIWQQIFDSDFRNDSRCILLHDDFVYFSYTQAHDLPGSEDYFNNTVHIVKFNNEGEIIDEFGSETWLPNIVWIHEMVKVNDQIFIAGGKIFYSDDVMDPIAFSIESSGSFNWFDTFETNDNIFASFSSVTNTTDGDIVFLYADYEEIIEDPLNGTENLNVLLVKYNVVGEKIWTRKFNFIQSTEDLHIARDLESTTDGGVIFAGYAADVDLSVEYEGARQFGWLVKTDACGCLVPGCDPNCKTGLEIAETDNPFIIGPNPATNGFLNIHYFQNENTESVFNIYDLSGRLIDSFEANDSNLTYILPTNDYSPGIYLVNLMQDGELVYSEKVLISN